PVQFIFSPFLDASHTSCKWVVTGSGISIHHSGTSCKWVVTGSLESAFTVQEPITFCTAKCQLLFPLLLLLKKDGYTSHRPYFILAKSFFRIFLLG
uniref:Uncharacterized protein n=1 Tax=Oryza glaberrima TaxID=4538 RepID=I1PTP9_ORYGL